MASAPPNSKRLTAAMRCASCRGGERFEIDINANSPGSYLRVAQVTFVDRTAKVAIDGLEQPLSERSSNENCIFSGDISKGMGNWRGARAGGLFGRDSGQRT